MNLLKTFSVYTFIKFFSAGVSFIVMPILTHYLTPKDYGVLSLVNLYISILVPLLSFRVFGILYVDYFNKKEVEDFRNQFSSVFVIPIVNFLFFISVGIIFRAEIGEFLNMPPFIIPLIPIASLLIIYNEHLQQFLIISKKTSIYTIVSFFKIIVETGFTVLLIVYLGYNWEGRIYSLLVVILLLSLYSIIYFYKQGYLNFKKIYFKYVKEALLYGSPLIIHLLGKLLINQSDRLFISEMVSVEELGIYNVGYTIGNVISILSGAFLAVYKPFLFERLADINFKKKIEIMRLSYMYGVALIAVLILLSLFSPLFFKHLISIQFSEGVKYVFWISLSYFFWGIYLLFVGYLHFFKHTKLIGMLAIVNVIINLILNYFCIQEYGAIGAAYATCISFFLVTVITGVISLKKFPMPWLNFRQIIKTNVK